MSLEGQWQSLKAQGSFLSNGVGQKAGHWRLSGGCIHWLRPKADQWGPLPSDFKGTGLEGQGQPFKAHCGVSAGVVPTPRGADQRRPPFGPLPLR